MEIMPGQATLEDLARVLRNGASVKIRRSAKAAIDAAAHLVAAAAAGGEPVYGVNTGFGKLASIRIAPGDTATLQR
ncbi:MAG: aromatic amino acid lyase, partial [Hyphomicrobiaceae bacterium]|nr:aromatic amino acid lyase [Hyphomicrobiaceae bacterium]